MNSKSFSHAFHHTHSTARMLCWSLWLFTKDMFTFSQGPKERNKNKIVDFGTGGVLAGDQMDLTRLRCLAAT